MRLWAIDFEPVDLLEMLFVPGNVKGERVWTGSKAVEATRKLKIRKAAGNMK